MPMVLNSSTKFYLIVDLKKEEAITLSVMQQWETHREPIWYHYQLQLAKLLKHLFHQTCSFQDPAERDIHMQLLLGLKQILLWWKF